MFLHPPPGSMLQHASLSRFQSYRSSTDGDLRLTVLARETFEPHFGQSGPLRLGSPVERKEE